MPTRKNMNRKSAPKTTTRKHMKLGKRTTTKRGKRTLQRGGVVPEKLKCDIKDTFEYKGKHYCFFTKVQDVPEGNTKKAIIRTVNYAMGLNNPIYTYMVKYPKKNGLTIITLDYIQTLDGELENPPAEIKRKLASNRRRPLGTSSSRKSPNNSPQKTKSRRVTFKPGSNEKVLPSTSTPLRSASMSGEKPSSANNYGRNRELMENNLDELEIKDGKVYRHVIFPKYTDEYNEDKGYKENKGQLKTYNITPEGMISQFSAKNKDSTLDDLLSQNKEAHQSIEEDQLFFTVYKEEKTNEVYICGYLEHSEKMKYIKLSENNTIDTTAIYIPPTELESTYDEPVHMYR